MVTGKLLDIYLFSVIHSTRKYDSLYVCEMEIVVIPARRMKSAGIGIGVQWNLLHKSGENKVDQTDHITTSAVDRRQ